MDKESAELVEKKIRNWIREAADKVDEKYLNFSVSPGTSYIVRERVFCYELYHQIRLLNGGLLSSSEEIILNGEIDKRGHPDYNSKEDRKKPNPDFVFHVQGSNENNIVVCEVKGRIKKSDVKKDFSTILQLLSHSYKQGVFLLYNYTFKDFKTQLTEILKEFIENSSADNIYILCLPKAGKVEEYHKLSELKQGN